MINIFIGQGLQKNERLILTSAYLIHPLHD